MDTSVQQMRIELRKKHETIENLGTPLYVISEQQLRGNYRTLRDQLDDLYPDSRIHFAVKSNFNLAVLAILNDEGAHAEAFSGCELSATLEAGFDPKDIILTGQNRDPDILCRGLRAGVGTILVDNETEFRRIEESAAELDIKPRVLLRANPAMDVPTNPEIATATRESKFGLDIESGTALEIARRCVTSSHVDLVGLHLHIGSQIQTVEAYATATRKMIHFMAEIKTELGKDLDVLDMGGGLPVPYGESVPNSKAIIETIADTIRESCEEHGLSRPELLIEPGRRIAATAGALVCTVGVIKETPYTTFAVLDAGTNVISSNWSYPIDTLENTNDGKETYTISGPLCYTGDVIDKSVTLPKLVEGSTLVIQNVGAYTIGSSNHMNAQPKPPIALLTDDGRVEIIREGEQCGAITRNDHVPSHLGGEK